MLKTEFYPALQVAIELPTEFHKSSVNKNVFYITPIIEVWGATIARVINIKVL